MSVGIELRRSRRTVFEFKERCVRAINRPRGIGGDGGSAHATQHAAAEHAHDVELHPALA
jgi:hypothetical protein